MSHSQRETVKTFHSSEFYFSLCCPFSQTETVLPAWAQRHQVIRSGKPCFHIPAATTHTPQTLTEVLYHMQREKWEKKSTWTKSIKKEKIPFWIDFLCLALYYNNSDQQRQLSVRLPPHIWYFMTFSWNFGSDFPISPLSQHFSTWSFVRKHIRITSGWNSQTKIIVGGRVQELIRDSLLCERVLKMGDSFPLQGQFRARTFPI